MQAIPLIGLELPVNAIFFPHKNKIMNAHIYHTELEGLGHVAPGNLEDIYDRLELLKGVASCDWWVIELKNTRDILHTKRLLTHYINASFASPLSDEEEIKNPPSMLQVVS